MATAASRPWMPTAIISWTTSAKATFGILTRHRIWLNVKVDGSFGTRSWLTFISEG
jgi:hypothetical protein